MERAIRKSPSLMVCWYGMRIMEVDRFWDLEALDRYLPT